MKKLLAKERVEIGAAITDGCKAIHGKSSNEFIALIDRQPPKQKRVRVKIVGLDTIRDDLESLGYASIATNMEPTASLFTLSRQNGFWIFNFD